MRQPSQRCNPLRRLQRLMRLATRRQRRAYRCRSRRRRGRGGAPRPASTQPSPSVGPLAGQTPAAPASRIAASPGRGSRGRGRPPTIPTKHVFCPVEGCRGYHKLGPDPDHWIVGAGTYATKANGRRQLYKCEWCQTRFSETQGTVFYGLKAPEETVYRALKALAEGVSIRSTARIFDVEVETVLRWLRRAGQHSEKVSTYLMRNLQACPGPGVEQAQLDELWTFVRKKEKMLTAWEKLHTEWGDILRLRSGQALGVGGLRPGQQAGAGHPHRGARDGAGSGGSEPLQGLSGGGLPAGAHQ
ncbi:MAG: hypothetical protein ACE5LU_27435 [Anaerolineae bacterium]